MVSPNCKVFLLPRASCSESMIAFSLLSLDSLFVNYMLFRTFLGTFSQPGFPFWTTLSFFPLLLFSPCRPPPFLNPTCSQHKTAFTLCLDLPPQWFLPSVACLLSTHLLRATLFFRLPLLGFLPWMDNFEMWLFVCDPSLVVLLLCFVPQSALRWFLLTQFSRSRELGHSSIGSPVAVTLSFFFLLFFFVRSGLCQYLLSACFRAVIF